VKRPHERDLGGSFHGCDGKRPNEAPSPERSYALSSPRADVAYAGPGLPDPYEASGSASGRPMIDCILIISRANNLETCIWLVPISTAISDCDRCS